MEHLSAPLHWANVPVYSKSLKGCAFEFASYLNTSFGHICLRLPWYCRQSLLDSNDHFCTPLASNSLLAKCIETEGEKQHAPVCASVCLKDWRRQSPALSGFCEMEDKKKGGKNHNLLDPHAQRPGIGRLFIYVLVLLLHRCFVNHSWVNSYSKYKKVKRPVHTSGVKPKNTKPMMLTSERHICS